MKKRYQIEKYMILFAIGGMAYFLLEVLVRGYSHYSMFLCGGACFLCCGLLNENVKVKMSFISQMVLSSVIITALEFVTGVDRECMAENGYLGLFAPSIQFYGTGLFIVFSILVSYFKCCNRAG